MSALTELEAPAVRAHAAPRVDLYAHIHKALRLFMGDTLARVGRVDIGDPAELGAALGQLEGLLDLCRSHLAHENEFVHAALEARRPSASERIAGEHEEHLAAIAGLSADAAALWALPSTEAAHRLYRHLAVFVGENFIHMDTEETAHNAALWAAYSDAELLALHDRLVASIDPAEMAVVLRWMVPAMNPVERVALLGSLQQQLPAAAFQGVLNAVQPHLSGDGCAKLARALGLPPVPGLVGV